MEPMNLGETKSPLTPVQEKAVRYLKFLSPDQDNHTYYLEQWGVQDSSRLSPLEITTPEECIDCMASFFEVGMWLGYLFNRGNVWSIFIKSLADEEHHLALNIVMAEPSYPDDLILYLRACYRFGHSVIPDQEYDLLEKYYIGTYPRLAYLNNQTYEEDALNGRIELAIKKSGFKTSKRGARKVGGTKMSSETAAALNAEKSTSIRPVRSYEEVFEFLKSKPACVTHWSLKADGINTKAMFKDGGLEVALSRGRASDSWDFTAAVNNIIAMQGIVSESMEGKVTGESIVDPEYLPTMRDKYPGKDYKSPKSAAAALLRAPDKFDPVDYEHLRFYPFEYNELNKDEAFAKFAEHKFSILPHKKFEAGEIPLDSIEEFTEWIDKVLDYLWEESTKLGIGSDGVVLQLIGVQDTDRADKYSDINVAIKMSHWTEVEYTSKVVGFELEQRRVEMSCVIIVEPVITRDLNQATRVSAGSAAILVADGVKAGDTIKFTRKSEAINIYMGKVEDNVSA